MSRSKEVRLALTFVKTKSLDFEILVRGITLLQRYVMKAPRGAAHIPRRDDRPHTTAVAEAGLSALGDYGATCKYTKSEEPVTECMPSAPAAT